MISPVPVSDLSYASQLSLWYQSVISHVLSIDLTCASQWSFLCQSVISMIPVSNLSCTKHWSHLCQSVIFHMQLSNLSCTNQWSHLYQLVIFPMPVSDLYDTSQWSWSLIYQLSLLCWLVICITAVNGTLSAVTLLKISFLPVMIWCGHMLVRLLDFEVEAQCVIKGKNIKWMTFFSRGKHECWFEQGTWAFSVKVDLFNLWHQPSGFGESSHPQCSEILRVFNH